MMKEAIERYAGIFKVNWSEFEKEVKEIYKDALEEREEKWLR